MSEEITPPPLDEEESDVVEPSATPLAAPSAAGLESAPAPTPTPRPSMLYNPDSGKLDIKKLATWFAAIAGFIASVSYVGAHLTDWTRWWLDLDNTESRLTTCEERLGRAERSLPEVWRSDLRPPRDPNSRLTEALPTITQHLRDGQKERRRQDQAITRLTTIHEFGLTRSRERAVAVEARRAVRVRDDDAASDEGSTEDPLTDLAGL